jgi:Holliday junction resolvasome RuvABC DNA-binding subunit
LEGVHILNIMTPTTTKDIENLVKVTGANAKAITDLTTEMKVGFADVGARLTRLEAQIENLLKATADNATAITNLTTQMQVGFAQVDTKLAKLEVLDTKIEERTKGFDRRLDSKELLQRGILTGSIVVVVGGLLLTIAKYIFWGIKA